MSQNRPDNDNQTTGAGGSTSGGSTSGGGGGTSSGASGDPSQRSAGGSGTGTGSGLAGTGATDAGTTRGSSAGAGLTTTTGASGGGGGSTTSGGGGGGAATGTATGLATQAKEYGQKAMDAATTAKDYLSDKASVVGDKLQDLRNVDYGQLAEDAKQYARQKPGQALLISAAAGFVIGLLLRGGRR